MPYRFIRGPFTVPAAAFLCEHVWEHLTEAQGRAAAKLCCKWLKADHKIVYGFRLFVDFFARSGFNVDLLEYCDENGRFHYHQWFLKDGPIYHSLLLDHRHRGGNIESIALIVDARKPL
jgi:predicted SAM-dependent methyltransferase